MNVSIAFLLVLIAGIINGSFASLSKNMPKWSFENIWLQYSVWAFILFPWITIAILAPQVLKIYAATPLYYLLIMTIGGFLFGIGQVGFALAIDMIGIGLTFVICLGLSMSFGFLLPLILQHPNQISTPFGILTLFGTILAIAGLIIVSYAGQLRDKGKNLSDSFKSHSKYFYIFGVLFAVIAGLFSAGQNLSFSLTTQIQHIATQLHTSKLGAANIMWPGFLICSFIPYAAYMLYLHKKNNSFSNYSGTTPKKYYLFSIIMGFCWFGSIIFYSKASQLIGKLGPIIAWPLFMALIILTSLFMSWFYKEWRGCDKKAIKILWIGICFILLAVAIFAYISFI
jgi:L-rhamnose-H+ transport protein